MLEATLDIIRLTSGESTVDVAPVARASVTEPVRLDMEDLYCILQLDPNDSVIALELANRLRARGRFDEALKVLRNVVKIDSRFETLNALAQVEYHLDMIDESLHHLQQAALIAPDDVAELFEVFKTLGNIFVRRGEFELAEDSYHKAHRLNGGSDVLRVNLGTLCIQRQQWDEALDHFRGALEINIANDKAWVGLALGHRVKGDFELAWGNIEAALEYNPLNETALGLALEWSTHEGREFRALELIRAYLIEGGWNERMSLAFSWLSWRRGETVAARLELERLLTVQPDNEQALKLRAEMRNHA
ncbi:MAG TPA: tetratricopeptide repeat protein [Bdellovibrionales bacterium]|nr:tetratricopeptide repeat protein [Bdellovibrionales bacterium]